MKKVFICLAFAAALFSSCPSDGGDGGSKLEVVITNDSEFDLSRVTYRDASPFTLKRGSKETINVRDGESFVTFDFTPKGKDGTVSCRTATELIVSETQRTIIINNDTLVVDVNDSANSGKLSQITLSIKQYTVTFDPAGGTVSPTSKQVSSGGFITVLPIPTKAGNTFGGWYTRPEGGGTQFTPSTKVDANIIVYAKWTVVSARTGEIQVANLVDYVKGTHIDFIAIHDAETKDIIQSKIDLNLTYGFHQAFTVPPGDYIVEVLFNSTSKLTTARFSVLAGGMRKISLTYTVRIGFLLELP